MKTKLAIILCITSTFAHADDWTGPDKTKHAEWSSLYGAIASAYINEPGLWNWKASGLCIVPGVLKEVKDKYAREGSGFSTKDVAADAVGCAVGIAVTQQTYVRLMHRNDKTSIVLTMKF